MHWILLIRDLDRGGAQRQVIALAGELVDRGHTVTVMLFYRGGNWLKELDYPGVRVVCLFKKSRWDVLPFLMRLVIAARAERPDVLISYLSGACAVSTLLRPLLKTKSLIWSIRASNLDHKRYGRVHEILEALVHRLSPLADGILFNSLSAAQSAAQLGFRNRRIAHVDNSIDFERFQFDGVKRLELRHRLGVADDTILIGMLGRLDPMKDHNIFIAAAAAIRAQSSERYPYRIRFVCGHLGSPSALAALIDQCKALGLSYFVQSDSGFDPTASVIFFDGTDRNIESLYSALEIFTLCSAYGEGFPNVLAEALSAGCHCVTTDVGDAARVIGSCGPVIPPSDLTSLVAAWQDLIRQVSPGSRHPQAPQEIAIRFGRNVQAIKVESFVNER